MSICVETFFGFSFGGNADFGEVCPINSRMVIDFPEEQAAGYGMAIRNGIDAVLSANNSVDAMITVTNPVRIKIEFVGTNKVPVICDLKTGENKLVFSLPEMTCSELKFFVDRRVNKELPKIEIRISMLLLS
ncbi:MAG: hypothetical protein PHP54_03865 [Clostridia bacterium]|nr:hypothetical protein [Clostridia bacterium]